MLRECITITGINHYYGLQPFVIGKKIKCIKEAKNQFDKEAIRAKIKGVGTVGYVANSPYTVAQGTMSAGRIYDLVDKKFVVEVIFIAGNFVICSIIEGLKMEIKFDYRFFDQQVQNTEDVTECIFDTRDDCTLYLQKFFDKETAFVFSDVIRKGKLRHHPEIQKILDEKLGKDIAEQLLKVRYLPK